MSRDTNLCYGMYPYPLPGPLDQELLAAHAEVHRFQDWPGAWPSFLVGWSQVGGTLFCQLRDSINGRSTEPAIWSEEFRSIHLMHRSLVHALK